MEVGYSVANAPEKDEIFEEALLRISQNMSKSLKENPFEDEVVLRALAAFGVGSGWINLYQPESHNFYSLGREFLIESPRTPKQCRKLQAEHFDSEIERDASSSHGVALELYLIHTAIDLINKRNLKLQQNYNAQPRMPTPAKMLEILREELIRREEKRLAYQLNATTANRLLKRLHIAANGDEFKDKNVRKSFLRNLVETKTWDWIPFHIVFAEERLATIICYECLRALADSKITRPTSPQGARGVQPNLWGLIQEKYYFIKRIEIESWSLDCMKVVDAVNNLAKAFIRDRSIRADFLRRVRCAQGDFKVLLDEVFVAFNKYYVDGHLQMPEAFKKLDKESACRANAVKATGWKHLLIFPVIVDDRFQGCFLGEFLFERYQLAEFKACREKLRAMLQPLALAMLLPSKAERSVEPVKRAYEAARETLDKYQPGEIIGESDAIQKVVQSVEQVAPTLTKVLLTGKSGVGKNVVARAIHNRSPCADGPFIEVNCGQIAEDVLESELFGHEEGAFSGAISQRVGKFELADSGTIFLNEVGEMSPKLQLALLRVIETGEFERVGGMRTIKVDTRIIAATNKCLEDRIKTGEFRDDLFYRLNVFRIHIPPLRDRCEDIPLLVDYILAKLNVQKKLIVEGVSEDAMHALKAYHWPGNIRELENYLEFASVLTQGGIITKHVLPSAVKKAQNIPSRQTLRFEVKEMRKKQANEAMHKAGSKKAAAENLGITRPTFDKWLKGE